MITVFLAGEGATELGGWAAEGPYRTTSPGILQALLERVAPSGWEVHGSAIWKSIRKYTVRSESRDAEVKTVLGLALHADENELDVLVFSRDRDRDEEREGWIEEGIVAAQRQFPSLKIVGGVAVEEIEAWTLAAQGMKKAHQLPHPKETFAARNPRSDVRSQVDIIREADLSSKDLDAPSLTKWLDRARSVFSPVKSVDAPVFLIGFMATGKTTVGGMLAKRLHWSHVDLDQEISRIAGKAVSDIFASEGEGGFRQREQDVLRSLSSPKTVISTGGGAGAQEHNLTWMLQSGRVVTLAVTAEEAVRRARGGKGRPLLEGQADPVAAAAELLQKRAPFYARAHFTVDTVGRPPHDVTKDILDWIGTQSPGKVGS